jgi:lipopolysaccharide export system permease protein
MPDAGRVAGRHHRRAGVQRHWIALPNGLLSTEIEYGPPAVLHHLTYYKRDSSGQLSEVAMAATAQRIEGTNLWRLRDGSFWTTGRRDNSDAVGTVHLSPETMVPFKERSVSLDLNPLWLSVYGMETQYLPLETLQALVRTDPQDRFRGLYRTRLQVLYGEILLPGAMALLAASLAMFLMPYRISGAATVAIVFTGYMAHFATKACLLMGQNHYMPAVMAGWIVPVGLCIGTIAVLYLVDRGRRKIVA